MAAETIPTERDILARMKEGWALEEDTRTARAIGHLVAPDGAERVVVWSTSIAVLQDGGYIARTAGEAGPVQHYELTEKGGRA